MTFSRVRTYTLTMPKKSPLDWWLSAMKKPVKHGKFCLRLDSFWESLSPNVPSCEWEQGQAWAEDTKKRAYDALSLADLIESVIPESDLDRDAIEAMRAYENEPINTGK